MSDQELLQAFVQRRDEEAFRQIVERYLRVVYAAARRQVHDAHLAEDVTQAVFIMLAKKAGSLRDGTILAGWLIKAARLAAKSAARGEGRRKRRERRAAEMNPTDETIVNDRGPLPRVDEELDDALNGLNAADRTAVTLRYLHDRPIKEVAEIMGTSEAAANKRALRAVAKLRDILVRRGIHVSPAVIGEVMRQQSHAALPPTLTVDVTAKSALDSVAGSAAVTAAATIANAALAGIAWKSSLTIAASLLLVATALGAGTYVYNASLRSAAAARAAAPTPAAAGPIKVGVYVSLNNDRLAGARSRDQLLIFDELNVGSGMEFYPLVEPGTEKEPRMMRAIALHFIQSKPIDVTDSAAIGKMDVIVVSSVHYPTVPAMEAIEIAVRGGTGLIVRQCLGGDDMGYARPVVRRLRAMNNSEPDALNTTGPSDAAIVGSHPLLGSLSGKLDATIPMQAFSGYGDLADGAIPLIKLKTIEKAVYNGDKSPVRERPGYGIYPLVVGQLGEGRLVSCSFPAQRVPLELDKATRGMFMVRAVRWAAGRAVE